MIIGSKERAILAGSMRLLHLRRDWRTMRFVGVGKLMLGRTDLHASLPSIKGDMRGVVHDDGFVYVNIGDIYGVHAHDGSVVEE